MVVEKPAIQWVGAHPANFERGHDGLAWEAVVLHVAEGTMAGIDTWFNEPNARASTHFAVGRDGAVHQYVSLADTAYGHGAIEPGYTATLIDANRRADGGARNPNTWAIGVEHEGKSGDAMSPAQFEASTGLVAWLFATALLPGGASDVRIDRDHILRHAEISPRTRARCPGYPEETLARYVARVREVVEGPVQPPRPAPPAQPSPAEAYARRLQDALTVQAAALDDLAARATIQAANLRAAVRG